MPVPDPTEWGVLREKVRCLEEDMEKVLGDKPSSLVARVGELEGERKTRLAVHATLATGVTCVFAAVVWLAQSGVIERVDALRQDLHRQNPRIVASPSGRVP